MSDDGKSSIAVVMPAFNESEGISGFLEELASELPRDSVNFFVVDDCSTDSTLEVLHKTKEQSRLSINVLVNNRNLGHGPSTVRALAAGLNSGAQVIAACDGDGQVSGADMRRIIDRLELGDVVYVEGVRVSRGDAFYRRAVSQAIRFLVLLRCRKLPRDANTPFRAYRRESLAAILGSGRVGDVIPNLDIATYVRISDMKLAELPVQARPRRGSDVTGSTWGRGMSILPNRNFIRFCIRAVIDWKRRAGS